MTPEQAIDTFGEKATKLKIALMDDEEGGLVLIEGGADDLRFLGQLLLAVASGGAPGLQLDPRGAGSTHFDPSSRLGVYIHRRCSLRTLRRCIS